MTMKKLVWDTNIQRIIFRKYLELKKQFKLNAKFLKSSFLQTIQNKQMNQLIANPGLLLNVVLV